MENMDKQSLQEILEFRGELEKDIEDFLEEIESVFSLEDVQAMIFEEEETDDMTNILAMFDDGGGVADFGNALDLVIDAWNYFPHKTLNGRSPAEVGMSDIE